MLCLQLSGRHADREEDLYIPDTSVIDKSKKRKRIPRSSFSVTPAFLILQIPIISFKKSKFLNPTISRRCTHNKSA